MPFVNQSKALVKKHPHSESSKAKMREKRLKWLAENPDRHPWKSKERFKSVPCENLKRLLRLENVAFIEEYSPIEGKFVAIDIAFPEKRIGLEVNGNQHYDADGKLKPYYQTRHNLLTKAGWIIYEIHYSCCFKQERITPIIKELLNSPKLLNFDYLNYVPRKKLEKLCGVKIWRYSAKCRKCESKLRAEKISNIPTKSVLTNLIWQMPTTRVAKQFGVSDKAVEKWCKSYGIAKPPRGYWCKSPEEQASIRLIAT